MVSSQVLTLRTPVQKNSRRNSLGKLGIAPDTISSAGLTYDALDRVVEQNKSGTYYQVVYTPMGSKFGIFKAGAMQQVFVPLPGGVKAEYYSWGLSDYRHPDWLGSARMEANTSRNVIDNNAYAPFGEPYAQTGNGEISFTGQNKDTVWLQYDFLMRQYDPKQGRWASPDPAGIGAVDPGNPQSWNRYAYVLNDPLAMVDLLGDQCYDPTTGHDTSASNPDDCMAGGGAWYDPSSGNTYMSTPDGGENVIASATDSAYETAECTGCGYVSAEAGDVPSGPNGSGGASNTGQGQQQAQQPKPPNSKCATANRFLETGDDDEDLGLAIGALALIPGGQEALLPAGAYGLLGALEKSVGKTMKKHYKC